MEDKILIQGTVLLITSLAGIVLSLIVYIWISSRRDNDNTIKDMKLDIEKNIDMTNDHETRITRIETICNTINCNTDNNKKKRK